MQISQTSPRISTPPPQQQKPKRTALQKHVDFFDRNDDGLISGFETFRSLRKLGLGFVRSAVAATAINGLLGPKTTSAWYRPFTIDTANIHKGKHGGDTDTYDENGRYVSEKHEAIFTNFDLDKNDALNQSEIDLMIATNKEGDAVGAFASKQEFGMLMDIAGTETPNGPEITRETLGGLYDGTLFYEIAGETPPEG